ncbi:hypothetical protein A45J_1243 [hot springs metagenome]|uniref:Uncharacterized protein n=1 Tax=hot springs metagenome TaxID=433727 RepID=A0A5J4L5N2_9ZZZZ
MMSRYKNKKIPDRYRHINQFIENIEGKGQEINNAKEVISRKEAAHRILGIIKKLGLTWQRKTQPLSGWRDSL